MTTPSPPGPSAWSGPQMLLRMRRDPLGHFERMAREYGDVVLARVGPRRVCFVFHPDPVREVLVTRHRSFIKSPALRRTKTLLGEGLLTSEGEHHLRQRRLAQPAFHRDRVAAYGGAMVERSAHMADAWRDGARLDAHAAMLRLTLGITGATLFGAEVEDEADEIGRALDVAMLMFRRATLPFTEWMDGLPLPSNRRFYRAKARLDATIARMIREHRAGGDRGDLLSMLLMAQDVEGDGGGMSDEQVRDEAITIFLAGHETTANGLTWAWELLARHPRAEAALHAELDAVLAGRDPTPDDVPRLPYTRAVFAEAMRLYPPAWVIGRQAVEPVEIGGYLVPAGALVLLSTWVIHRDARHYDAPLEFRPERWLETPDSERPRFAYFPFSGGVRKCIGEGFAWMEGVLVLATLARRWRLRPLSAVPPTPQPLITLRPAGGVQVELRAR